MLLNIFLSYNLSNFNWIVVSFKFLLIWESVHMWGAAGQREKEKQTPHWAGSPVLAPSQEPGIMTWDEGRWLTHWATWAAPDSIYSIMQAKAETSMTKWCRSMVNPKEKKFFDFIR